MNKILLPDIKSIHLKNFTLFPGDLDYKYEFVHGVNLVLGGNGMGKTTFVNLLRYGIIGLYRKDFGFTRTYRDKKIEKRIELPENYFANRMEPTAADSDSAEVTIVFRLGDTQFEVKRDIHDFLLREVKLIEKGKETLLKGEALRQSKYERLDDEEKKRHLQFCYEEAVAKKANVYDFDDFIFFINEVLFFGEDRKLILWDAQGEGIQERLSSKYFNDPSLDNKREEALRQAKYFDSLSRHRSEDIRAINKVIRSIEYDSPDKAKLKESVDNFTKLKQDAEKKTKQLERIHHLREKVDNEQRVLRKSKNMLGIEISELEKEINELNYMLAEQTWIKLNPKYEIYQANIRKNEHCPMCSQKISSVEIERLKGKSDTCFLCNQKIRKPTDFDPVIASKRELLSELLKQKQSIDTQLVSNEAEVESLDLDYEKTSTELFELKRQIRSVEHLINRKSQAGESSYELEALLNEIAKLEASKKKLSQKSNKEKTEAADLTKVLEEQNTKITQRLSKIFTKFAEKFLGVKGYLTYDDFKDGKGKRFTPVIDGRVRIHSEELSESQRFFVEHSYRMSLLHFFYEQPSFFICETPDSSLDISYERNAADIFLGYLDRPNALILTTNLNNSEFMNYIIDNAPRRGIINLFEIGKKSAIQEESPQLKSLLDKLNKRFYAGKD